MADNHRSRLCGRGSAQSGLRRGNGVGLHRLIVNPAARHARRIAVAARAIVIAGQRDAARLGLAKRQIGVLHLKCAVGRIHRISNGLARAGVNASDSEKAVGLELVT